MAANVEMAEAWTPSIGIARPAAEVYAYLADPRSFEEWASGLGGALEETAGGWSIDGDAGRSAIRFTARNAFGVLDHWLTPPGGGEVYVPMRVVANGGGCEVLITIYRQPGVSDEKLAEDLAWVSRDLAALKRLAESGSGGFSLGRR